MITMWIIFGVAAAMMAAWRLNRANATLGRMLDDDAESESQTLPASYDR